MTPTFYRDRICLNVLASDADNMREIYDATEGNVLIGVLSSKFDAVDKAVDSIKNFNRITNGNISLGLGAGDPKQWKMVADICSRVEVAHINQVFPAVGYTRASSLGKDNLINGLVKPTETVGVVNIATGPLTSGGKKILVSVEEAIMLIKEMGGNSLKFFPMDGLSSRKQYIAVAEACAKMDFILEPTGGIDRDNFEEIVSIALTAGVQRIIPHVYSSIISRKNGKTNISDVAKLYSVMKRLGKQNG